MAVLFLFDFQAKKNKRIKKRKKERKNGKERGNYN